MVSNSPTNLTRREFLRAGLGVAAAATSASLFSESAFATSILPPVPNSNPDPNLKSVTDVVRASGHPSELEELRSMLVAAQPNRAYNFRITALRNDLTNNLIQGKYLLVEQAALEPRDVGKTLALCEKESRIHPRLGAPELIARHTYVELCHTAYATAPTQEAAQRLVPRISSLLGSSDTALQVVELRPHPKSHDYGAGFPNQYAITGLSYELPGGVVSQLDRVRDQLEIAGIFGSAGLAHGAYRVLPKRNFESGPQPQLDYESLPSLGNAARALTDGTSALLSRLRKQRMLWGNEEVSILVRNVLAGEDLVDIGASEARVSASMVKVIPALVYMKMVELGAMNHTPEMSEKLRQALCSRDPIVTNSAANEFFSILGGAERVNTLLHQHFGHLFADTTIIEDIPDDARAYKNTSSPRDFARFFDELRRGNLPGAFELKRIMSIEHGGRIAKGLPDETYVLNKTGTTQLACGDAALVAWPTRDGSWQQCSMVVIVQRESRIDDRLNDAWKERVMGITTSVSRYIHQELTALA